jgi:type IV pilus assembly protein PilY1
MASHLAPRSRRSVRAAVSAVVVAALLAPAAADARQFGSGSLIIPSSVEYQSDDGVLSTYAMIYIALWKNASRAKKVTFYWAVEPRKLSQYRCDTATSVLPRYSPTYNDNDACDFYVRRDAGQPVSFVGPTGTLTAPFNISNVTYQNSTGPVRANTTRSVGATTTVMKYLGGVWIVDATDREEFLKMLSEEPTLARFHANGAGSANFVNIHSANANFDAPIVSIVKDRPPRIAATGDGSATNGEFGLLVNVLENAGLCQADTVPNCGGTFNASGFASGLVYDFYPNPDDLLADSTGCSDGRINCTVNGETYGSFWASDSTGPGMISAQGGENLSTFLETKGNTAFVQYDAIWRVENQVATGKYLTTAGVLEFQPNVSSAEDCNDQTLPVGSKFRSNGGDCLVLGGANQPWAQVGNFMFDGGQGDFKAFSLNGGSFEVGVTQVLRVKNSGATLGPTVSAAMYKDNDPEKGLIFYLAGHRFDNGRLWGERLILNTLFSHLGEANPEFARSEPVGYQNTRVSPVTTRVYQGTYIQRPPPESNDVQTYNWAAAQIWSFPYIDGYLYEYDVSDLRTSAESFGSLSGANWNAGAGLVLGAGRFMKTLPAERRIYTYGNGSANLSWKRIPFDESQTTTACWDGDGNLKCDLSEMLAVGVSAGVTTAALKAKNDVDQSQALRLALLVSQVRGHCAAHSPAVTGTPIPAPTDAQCDSPRQKNRAKLGGIDHSTPAVVGPSRYITDTVYGARPVVIYAGARDGMLHAFFVSSNSAAWADEHGNTLPAGVVGGQELWAIVPPAQVPKLASNAAMVDGTVNVVDVFGDFPYDRNGDGVIDWAPNANPAQDERPNGIRRWRTVLIGSAGEGESELFALDVTSPVHPVLLWHIRGAVERDNRWDTDGDGAFEAGETFAPGVANPNPSLPATFGDPRTFALKWTDGVNVDYFTTNNATIFAMKEGRYNYRNLGETYSTAVAKVWAGSGFQYLLFAATNAQEGSRGAEVFAIDVVTGRKQWQWEHLYDGDGAVPAAGVDNSIPPRMALGDIDANGSTERIYVGDLEGHIWELYSRDGRNVNYLKGRSGGTDAYRSFPLFGTPQMTGTDATPPADTNTTDLYEINGSAAPAGLSQQPLTTPIGQGRFTQVPTGKESFLLGRLSLVVGTMGVDWSIAPFEKGHLFVIPVHPDQGTRLAEPIDMDGTRNPMLLGILDEDAAWQINLGVGERVYGMPRVVNNRVIFNTAFGSFSGDISATATDPGNLWIVGPTAATSSTASNDAKSFGGVLIIGGDVVVTTDQSIRKLGSAPDVTGGGVGVRTFNRATPAIMKSWESGVTP